MTRLTFTASRRASFFCPYFREFSTSPAGEGSNKNIMFLHVGPSGDCWIGTSIYAAKHLQPDYVKSIQIPQGISNDAILMALEDDIPLAQLVYDEGKLPPQLLEKLNDDTTYERRGAGCPSHSPDH